MTGTFQGNEQAFMLNGDNNNFTPEYTMGAFNTGLNTFGGRMYELTVGGDSQSSRGRFGNPNQQVKRAVQPAAFSSLFD